MTIDCNLPVAAPSVDALLPYMEDAWAARFKRSHFQMPMGNIIPRGRQRKLGTGASPTPQETSEKLASEIEAAILIPLQAMPAAGWCDTPIAHVFTSALNSYFIEHWLPVDPRFRLAMAISAHEPELAVAEIERIADNPRIVAIVMPVLFANLGRSHYYPIYEAAIRHGLPIIIHISGQEGFSHGAPTIGGVGPWRSEERYALMPQVAQANIASLIYDGVFVRYPDLRIVFSGYGFEWAPPLMWKADQEWRNLRIDIPWLTSPPSHFLAQNIRIIVDDIGYAPVEYVRDIIEALPPQFLMYGTNGPFAEPDAQPVGDAIPAEQHDAFKGQNARETFSRLAA